MIVEVKVGDVLDENADVLICTANPQLSMSGGVNGAILLRGGESIQEELRQHLRKSGRPIVDPATVVRTGPGPIPVKIILHAVAINAFYESSVELVEQTIRNAFRKANELGANSIAMPTLATGYGPLSYEDFAHSLRLALNHDWSPVERLTVVLRKEDAAEAVRTILNNTSHS